MIRYVPPRRAELDQEEKGNVFNDERTRRKKADKYTGKDAEIMQFEKEIKDTAKSYVDDRPFAGTNITPTPKQKLRRMMREKSGTKT